MTTADEDEATKIARHLDALNRERQAIEAAVLEEAIEQLESASQCRRAFFGTPGPRSRRALACRA